jgi:hypothetical protein
MSSMRPHYSWIGLVLLLPLAGCGSDDPMQDTTAESERAQTVDAAVMAAPVAGAGVTPMRADPESKPKPPSADTLPAPEEQGDVQHCVASLRCLEFRMHMPRCFESNAENCSATFAGEYGVGPCDASDYPRQRMVQSSCGVTIEFAK